jgi:hypothetical protein
LKSLSKGIVLISATYTLSYLAALFANISIFNSLFPEKRNKNTINKLIR